MTHSKKRFFSRLKSTFLFLFFIIIIGLLGIAIYNLKLPKESPHKSQLSDVEFTRLSEVTHLRAELGNEIWPGWENEETPLLIYNEAYAFLVGMNDPKAGWIRVPYKTIEGGTWKKIETDDYHYYRQELPESGETPQAFIVEIGDDFVASMTTKDWTKIQLMQMIQADLPGFLKPIMPYSLFINRFDSDWHVTGILHESFHAFQANQAYERLRSSEHANSYHNQYPWDSADMRESWLQERQMLAKALMEDDKQEIEASIREWLAIRNERREKMDSTLISYEKQREWLEGAAKYAELKSLELASNTKNYIPLDGMKADADFNFYNNAEDHLKQEIRQLKSDLQFSESIFYYSGWAQAELLDRLYPGWKLRYFEEGVYLDDLLAEACIPISCPASGFTN